MQCSLAMFKRKNPRTTLQNIKEAFWPDMGWLRALKYAKHRMIRLSDSTENIAAGLAVGASISFSPLVGTHFFQCLALWYPFRFNLLASFVGTVIGNPWTFPFIWIVSISLGNTLMGLMGVPSAAALPDDVNFNVIVDLFLHEPFRILAPWMLGGYALALAVWGPFYFTYYYLISGAKAARAKIKKARRAKRAEQRLSK